MTNRKLIRDSGLWAVRSVNKGSSYASPVPISFPHTVLELCKLGAKESSHVSCMVGQELLWKKGIWCCPARNHFLSYALLSKSKPNTGYASHMWTFNRASTKPWWARRGCWVELGQALVPVLCWWLAQCIRAYLVPLHQNKLLKIMLTHSVALSVIEYSSILKNSWKAPRVLISRSQESNQCGINSNCFQQ